MTEQHHNEVLRRCRDALTHKSSSPDGRKHVCLEPDKCHVIVILIAFCSENENCDANVNHTAVVAILSDTTTTEHYKMHI